MFYRQEPAPPLPVTDYQAAIAGARQWLGDRYLLARPINAVRPPATSLHWQRERAAHRRYQRWLRQSSSSQAS